MSEWREFKIKEVANVVAGGTPKTSIHEYWNGSISWITPKDLSNHKNKYISNGSRSITDLGLKKSAAKLLPPETILLTSRAPIGYMAIAENEITTNQGFKNIICDKNKVNNHFLYYYLLVNMDQIKGFASGATFPEISGKTLKNIRIQIPNIESQTKIADVLSTYDRLIENNSRRIQILEQTAEELYKEWFVRMRFPGYENTKFDKGIPEGWEVQKLSGLIRVTDGTHDTPKEVTDGVPLVTGRNIINGQIDFNTTYNISKEDHKKINVRSSIEKYDVLYSNIGTIGQMAIVHNDNKYSVKNLIILKTSQYDCYEYIYLHFKNEACQRHFDSIASGASQKFISLTEMRNYKILIPKKETLEQFKIYVSNLFNQIVLLSNQNQNLIKQRDLLLLRLMNGTIIVK